MKTTIALAALLLLFTGCSMDTRSQEQAQLLFPGGQVVRLPEGGNHFIVKDKAGNVWYAEASGATIKVTGTCLLIRANQ